MYAIAADAWGVIARWTVVANMCAVTAIVLAAMSRHRYRGSVGYKKQKKQNGPEHAFAARSYPQLTGKLK